jgi:hypothetical protein
MAPALQSELILFAQTSGIYVLIKVVARLQSTHNDFSDIRHAAAALGPHTAGSEHSARGYNAQGIARAQGFSG